MLELTINNNTVSTGPWRAAARVGKVISLVTSARLSGVSKLLLWRILRLLSRPGSLGLVLACGLASVSKE